MMAGLIEKTFLLGLGVLTVTREKIREAVNELVESEELKPEEAQELVDVLVAKGERERQELRGLVQQELDNVRPVSRKEFEALSQKVDELGAQLEKMMEEPD